jgi:hypothetical protein
MSLPVERCDLCIVGAGLSGLNALFVASRHLSRDQRVILVDRRDRVGGMWVDTYPYVRLHQPHQLFTAGDIKWALGKKPAYLASKGEILDHFERCRRIIEERLWVDEFFGWTVESEHEADGLVRVLCRSADGRPNVIETQRLIKASGFRVDPNDPLDVSSRQVRSVSPDTCDMRDAPIANSDAPIWIIGGGKTAMDTAHTVITAHPGREVNLVAGSGTFFHDRDIFFPGGVRRWCGGHLTSAVAAEVARRFDGTNENDLWDWHRAKYGVWPTPEVGNFLLGFLSKRENDVIASGLNDVIMDHMVDVVDSGDAARMVLRSGATTELPSGSWIVNCTGYMTNRVFPYEPFLSPGGRVLSIQTRSATLHLTSYMGYFATHLWLAGKMRDVPLYELDMFELYRASHRSFPYALFALVQHNFGLYVDNLPARVFRECGVDFDRWYPLPRRVMATLKFMRGRRAERERLRAVLDTVRERLAVRCGPLPSPASDGG